MFENNSTSESSGWFIISRAASKKRISSLQPQRDRGDLADQKFRIENFDQHTIRSELRLGPALLR
jgi:hypothetical protein